MADLDSAHDDGYAGAVSVLVGDGTDGGDGGDWADRAVSVQASLRGYFEPLDGRYHWYGRLAPHDDLARLVGGGKASAVVRTTHGEAECVLGDVDPWGRLRISGVSTPPFPIVRTLDEVEAGPASASA